MCGLAGILDLNNQAVNKNEIVAMCNAIIHRGPDDEGYFVEGPLGLGHRRLSIIDLSPAGHQPMSNEDGTVWLIFNGEIYNFLELIPDLKEKGHVFKSKTDSEVVIHSYEEYGEDCLSRFNGMFAFVIWDKKKNKLFCVRDRFGVKPFFYFSNENSFVFASEIKALLSSGRIKALPNDSIICDYLRYGLVDHTSDSFFQGIKKLPAAHYLVIENSCLKVQRYWDIDPKKKLLFKNDNECIQQFHKLFDDSIRLRLRSDVPVGTCLSGGMDSSAIVCTIVEFIKAENVESIGNRLKTFSARFNNHDCDESTYMNAVIDNTKVDAHSTFPAYADLFSRLQEVVWHQDEPFCSTCMFAQWELMKLVNKNGVKVLLDGQGGDEILAGYHSFFPALFADLLASLHITSAIREYNYYRKQFRYNLFSDIKAILYHFIPNGLKIFFRNALSGDTNGLSPAFLSNFDNSSFSFVKSKYKSRLKNALYNSLTSHSLPSYLRYEDRMSMAFSIEARIPFLDYRLVEFVFAIKNKYKIHNGKTKYILREALKNILPLVIYNRVDKKGFPMPEKEWLGKDIAKEVRSVFTSDKFKNRRYFDSVKIVDEYEAFCNGKLDYKPFFWRCLNLELWLRRYIDSDVVKQSG